MASMKRPRLQKVEPQSDFNLHLTFIDGSEATVDFKPLFAESPRLASRLQDEAVFKQATLIEGEGWAVHWLKEDIQIGADTLWLDAQAQNAPDENTRIFLEWRARHGLSLSQAARELGLTPRTVSAYGTGARPVPRTVALACKGWEKAMQSS